MSTSPIQLISVDKFCHRQFPLSNPDSSTSYGGCKLGLSIPDFETLVNGFAKNNELQPGYAPFCKHLFISNKGTSGEDLTDARLNTVLITPENGGLLRTAYEARNEKELPILCRFFPEGSFTELPVATYLDIILYSRAQVKIENAAQNDSPTLKADGTEQDSEWAVVSIKPQSVNYELPMNPITILRNTLVEEGGSGVPIDKVEYQKAVDFWSKNAIVR